MNKSFAVLAASAVVAASQMYAATITGDISFTGSATLNGPVASATAFSGFTGVATGDSTQTGDYVGAGSLTSVTTFTPFTFLSGGLPSNPGPGTLWSFIGADAKTYSFGSITLSSVTKSSSGLLSSITISGTGVANITGFSATPGSFTIQFSGRGAKVAFASYATAVPEPTSWALVSGLGLAGFAFYRRARK
jgi:PEP-CTERM motif